MLQCDCEVRCQGLGFSNGSLVVDVQLDIGGDDRQERLHCHSCTCRRSLFTSNKFQRMESCRDRVKAGVACPLRKDQNHRPPSPFTWRPNGPDVYTYRAVHPTSTQQTAGNRVLL